MDRFGEKVCCNPTVKLKKQESYPVIDIDKITPGYKTVRSVESLEYAGQGGAKFQDHDVLFARITPCLENGKMAIADTDGQNGIGSTELFVFRGIEGVSDTDYIYYLLCMKHIRQLAANSMTGASGRQRADLDFIKRIQWDFPDIKIQKKISSVLSEYDNLIEVNNKRIKVLEQMAENLYKEWFVRFRFPGHETAEFENGIPKGWEYKRLDELLDIRYGKDHKNIEDGDIPIFGSGGLMRTGNKALYEGESVLIPRKGSLNNIMYYNGAFWTVDTMFYSIQLIRHFAKYAYFFLSNIDMESYNSGAALPSMTTDILYHFKLLVPNEEVLRRFDLFVSRLFEQKTIIHKLNENLVQQRDLLLPRLMSRKLEV